MMPPERSCVHTVFVRNLIDYIYTKLDIIVKPNCFRGTFVIVIVFNTLRTAFGSLSVIHIRILFCNKNSTVFKVL